MDTTTRIILPTNIKMLLYILFLLVLVYIFGTSQEELMIVGDTRSLNHTYAASLDSVFQEMTPVKDLWSSSFSHYVSVENWPFDFPNKSTMFMGETINPPPTGIPNSPSQYPEYDYSQIEYSPVVL